MCKKNPSMQGPGRWEDTNILLDIRQSRTYRQTEKKADGLMIWSHRQTNRHLGIDKPRCNQSVEGSLCSTVEAVETEVSL